MIKGEQFTFESFIVKKDNKEAFERTLSFAKNVHESPITIQGASGVGKTHLLYAVKNYIEHHQPEQKVILTNASNIMETLIDCIKKGKRMNHFREMYTYADVLLIDDVQFLAGKEKLQEEFICIFNEFYETGRRIMITLSSHKGLGERILTRCFYGKYVSIKTESMKVSIYSREEIEKIIEKGSFPENTAVISFYDPAIKRIDEDYSHVDYRGVSDTVFYSELDDLDLEVLRDNRYTYDTYFPEADEIASFVCQTRKSGMNIICQCEYGQSRSAGCAAAILEFFEHSGISIFANYNYYPNRVVYHKIYDALEKKKMSSSKTTNQHDYMK